MPSSATLHTTEVIASGWAKVKCVTFDLIRRDGRTARLMREVYEYGDGATVLPYDPVRDTVLLIRQFRAAAEINGGNGFLIEACAGLLDGDEPETCARREAEEELGYRLHGLRRIATAYVAPGAVAERTSLFAAHYTPADRISAGGGEEKEGEDIEVIEMQFGDAFAMIGKGGIVDMKTIVLLLDLQLQRQSAPETSTR